MVNESAPSPPTDHATDPNDPTTPTNTYTYPIYYLSIPTPNGSQMAHEWVEDYRDLLNGAQLWHRRAAFDVVRLLLNIYIYLLYI